MEIYSSLININIKNRNLIFLLQILLKMSIIYKLHKLQKSTFTTSQLQFSTKY